MDRSPLKPILLIADVNLEDVDVLKTILASDYDIKVAADGEEAIRLASFADAPGLILIGELPAALDMYEVCRQLKTGKTRKTSLLSFSRNQPRKTRKPEDLKWARPIT